MHAKQQVHTNRRRPSRKAERNVKPWYVRVIVDERPCRMVRECTESLARVVAPDNNSYSSLHAGAQKKLLFDMYSFVLSLRTVWYLISHRPLLASSPLSHGKCRLIFLVTQPVEGKGLVARAFVRVAHSRQDVCDVEILDESGLVVGMATVVFAVASPPQRTR